MNGVESKSNIFEVNVKRLYINWPGVYKWLVWPYQKNSLRINNLLYLYMTLRKNIFNYFFCRKIISKFYDWWICNIIFIIEVSKTIKEREKKKNKMFFKIKIAIRSDTHVIKRVSILPSMTIPITVHIYDQLWMMLITLYRYVNRWQKKNLM